MRKLKPITFRALTFFLLCATSLPGFAKEFEATVVSDPEGATVFLNGKLVCATTPAIISIDNKMVGKNLMFRFEKSGYEPKTVILSFDKKEIKKSPIIYGKLERDQQAVLRELEAEKEKKEKKEREERERQERQVRREDPTIPAGNAQARVSRDEAGKTAMEQSIIRWYFDSDPRGARVFYRVISGAPAEVKNTNENFLTNTPYEETKGFGIPGLTYENARNVTIEIKIRKKGYEDQVKRYNVRQALDQQEISGFFELVPKDDAE